jgi:hypothetical protein
MVLADGRRVIDAAQAAGVLPPPDKGTGSKVLEFRS